MALFMSLQTIHGAELEVSVVKWYFPIETGSTRKTATADLGKMKLVTDEGIELHF